MWDPKVVAPTLSILSSAIGIYLAGKKFALKIVTNHFAHFEERLVGHVNAAADKVSASGEKGREDIVSAIRDQGEQTRQTMRDLAGAKK